MSNGCLGRAGKINEAQGSGRLFHADRSHRTIRESRAARRSGNTGIGIAQCWLRRDRCGNLGYRRRLGRRLGSRCSTGYRSAGRFRLGVRITADGWKRLSSGQRWRPGVMRNRFEIGGNLDFAALDENFGLGRGNNHTGRLNAHVLRRCRGRNRRRNRRCLNTRISNNLGNRVLFRLRHGSSPQSRCWLGGRLDGKKWRGLGLRGRTGQWRCGRLRRSRRNTAGRRPRNGRHRLGNSRGPGRR